MRVIFVAFLLYLLTFCALVEGHHQKHGHPRTAKTPECGYKCPKGPLPPPAVCYEDVDEKGCYTCRCDA
ncbi:hypothetical protein JTE90_003894 [Oedothorax gibbosus]|uniref:Uncharacterized protein n=1 Tax=Oedothorax gibbosus TaxID=931172 RepID=A0AAV6UGP4_9ARAC|nr:hypothetical protein JTE90_003894 [Oedothorax gibbosus]